MAVTDVMRLEISSYTVHNAIHVAGKQNWTSINTDMHKWCNTALPCNATDTVAPTIQCSSRVSQSITVMSRQLSVTLQQCVTQTLQQCVTPETLQQCVTHVMATVCDTAAVCHADTAAVCHACHGNCLRHCSSVSRNEARSDSPPWQMTCVEPFSTRISALLFGCQFTNIQILNTTSSDI